MRRALALSMQRLQRLDDLQKDVLRFHCLLNSRVHQTGCEGGDEVKLQTDCTRIETETLLESITISGCRRG